MASLVLAGCAGPETATEEVGGGWVGDIRTEGEVTTVINESGSVWGGTARLVEEASIGVQVGSEPYMLGSVTAVLAHEGEIFVVDRQVAAIRVYDLDGTHLRDIGRAGSGPGEFSRGDVARAPMGMAVGPQGDLHVKTPTTIEVFSTAGEHVDTWTPTRRVQGFGRTDFQVAAPRAGSVVLAEPVRCAEPRPWPCGTRLLIVHEDGRVEETGTVPDLGYEVPRIEIEYEHGYGPEVTGGVPVFADLIAGHDDGLWAVRAGPGERLPGYDQDATDREAMRQGRCWRDTAIIDAFGPDGRYLGKVEVPEIFSDAVQPTSLFMPEPFVRGDMVLAVAQDDAGTIMVKRYRVVPPD